MLEIIETELTQISKGFAIMGGFIVIYGLVSYMGTCSSSRSIIVGPHVLNWVNPFEWGDTETYHEVTYQLARIVVGVQVLFTGILLPDKYLWKQWKSLSVLLILIMTTAWFITALFVWAMVDGLTFLEALCISSAVTPTDPVLANSITSGRFAEEHVEERVRHIILAESGANDGLGFPFLFLAVFLLARTHADYGTSIGEEVGRWIYSVLIYQILLSCVYGAVVGYVARKTLRWAAEHKLIDMSNFFSYGFGLAIFTLGTAGLFGTDDILACFVAGNSFTWDDWFRLRQEESDFQEIIDMLFNTAIFIYIGMIIPWKDYSDAMIGLSGWRIVVLGILVILFRRPPWVVLFYKIIPALHHWKEAVFAGWFGPIGVGAVYYIEVAIRKVPDDGTREHLRRVVNPVVLFCVFSSIVTHGFTVPIVYFGPGVVRHTRTLTRASTTVSPRPKRSWKEFFSHYFDEKEPVDEEADAAPDASDARKPGGISAPTDARLHDHYIPEHEPFSRARGNELPPDIAAHPHVKQVPLQLDSDSAYGAHAAPTTADASDDLPKPAPALLRASAAPEFAPTPGKTPPAA